MSPELISIYGLCAMFVVATLLPVNMGVLAFVGAFLVGTLVAGMADQGHHRRLPRRPVPDPGRDHLPVRAGAEQRHHRLAGPARGARRARPDRGDPMDHVRHRRGADRRRRGQPRCGRDHRPDRAGLRRPVRHQPAADGPPGDPRRAGRRLLADQHLWRHHQRRRRQGRPAAERARHLRWPASPSTSPWRCCCSSCSAGAGCWSSAPLPPARRPWCRMSTSPGRKPGCRPTATPSPRR